MDCKQTCYRLQFNNDLAIHQHSETIATIKQNAFVSNRQWDLTLNRDPS